MVSLKIDISQLGLSKSPHFFLHFLIFSKKNNIYLLNFELRLPTLNMDVYSLLFKISDYINLVSCIILANT